MHNPDIMLDVTKIQPHGTKHQVIFSRFESLQNGEYFILHNDHDPVPLHYQLRSMHGESFDWEYLQKGPTVFEVKITRRLTDTVEPTVGELVAEDYRRADFFRKLGIDFYSSNLKTLKESCKEAELDYEKVVNHIKILDNSPNRELSYFNEWDIDFLSDYIVHNHHTQARKVLPFLLEFSEKVVEMHAHTNPEVIEINEKLKQLSEDMLKHLDTEEKYLFPYVVKLVAAYKNNEKLPQPGFGSLEGPVSAHFEEHDTVVDLMKSIRGLTNGFKVPENACYTFRTLYNELYEFERDTQLHIHLENNILFGKAIALEKEVVEN